MEGNADSYAFSEWNHYAPVPSKNISIIMVSSLIKRIVLTYYVYDYDNDKNDDFDDFTYDYDYFDDYDYHYYLYSTTCLNCLRLP
jgi:hypothetical protein